MSQEQSFGWLRSALWPIHRNEKKMFVPLLIMLFLISFIQTILIGLKDSIVVTTSGAEAIPFIKMWAILPAALLITFIFTKLSNRYTQEIIFYLLTGGFLLFYGLFAFVIYPYRHVLNFVESAAYLDQVLPAGLRGLISIYRHWSLTGFYTICELWNTVVVSLLFWRFANEITQVSEARRFYSVLSIAYNIAVFGAGAFSAFLTYQYSEWEHVMMLSIFVIMGCGLALMGTFRWMQHVVKQPQESQRKDDTNKKPKLSLSESIAYVWKSQYLICIAVIVLAFGLVHNLVEVVWKDQIRALFPAILDYNHYLSNMQMIQGLLALVLSIGMAEGIKRLGWANVSLLTPVVMMVASLLFFGVMYFQDRLSPFFTAVGQYSQIATASKPFGGSWTPTQYLTDVGTDSHAIQIAIDPNGNAIAIWQFVSDTTNQDAIVIQTAEKPFGGSWSTPVDVTLPGPNTTPQIAIDSHGNATAIWVNAPYWDVSYIQAATKLLGQSWSSPTTLSDVDSNNLSPQLAVNSIGDAIAVWLRSDSSLSTTILSSTLPFGGSWLAPKTLSAAANIYGLRLAVDPLGNGVIIWQDYTNIIASTLPFNGSFTAPVPLTSSTDGSASVGSEVGVDAKGDAVVVWVNSLGSYSKVQSSTLPFGGSWSSPVTVSSQDTNGIEVNILDAHVAVNPSGTALALWCKQDPNVDPSTYEIQFSFLTFGGSWSMPANIVSDLIEHHQAMVAISPANNAVAVWNNENSRLVGFDTINVQNVNASFFTDPALPPPPNLPDPPLPPTNLQGKQFTNRFLTQTERFNVLTWGPPATAPTPVFYSIYRDSALTILIGVVPATSPLTFTDHNLRKNVVYSYFVTGVDQNGNVSPPSTVTVLPVK